MLQDIFIFLCWYVAFPLLVLNGVFICCNDTKSIWRSPCWEYSARPPSRQTLGDAETPRTDKVPESELTGIENAADTVTSGTIMPSAGYGLRKRRCQLETAGEDLQCIDSAHDDWKRDRSPLARIKSYLAMRIVSMMLPAVWLVNLFLIQQLLRRLLEPHKTMPMWHDVLLAMYAIYAIWCVFLAERFGSSLGKPKRWAKRLSLWRHAAEYFPLTILPETDGAKYTADKSYLIGFHPHGVISLSCSLGWGSESDWPWLNTRSILPGIDLRLTTLPVNMKLPFWRHVLQAVGFVSSSKENIKGFVSQGPGRAVVVVVGGAKEALLGGNGSNELVIRCRRGFFEVGLQTGSWLIPVFSLGENEMFCRPTGDSVYSKFLKVLSRVTMKISGFSLPVCHGRGSLQLFMPKRVKILTLVGEPVPCCKIDTPSDQDIDKLRTRYCQALERLFQKARLAYGPVGNFEDMRILY